MILSTPLLCVSSITCYDIAVFVVDYLGRAVLAGEIAAVLAGADREEVGRAAQGRGGDAHQADGAYAYDADIIAVLDVGELRAVETGGHHVAHHGGGTDIYALGQERKVAVGVVDVEKLSEHAVLEVGEFPSGKHAAGVHGISGLRLERRPVRGDGRHYDLVAGLEVLDEGADLLDDADSLMAKDHVMAVAYRALPHSVDIGCAWGHRYRTDYGVKRAARRPVFLYPAGFSYTEHRKTFHNMTSCYRYNQLLCCLGLFPCNVPSIRDSVI